MLTRMKIAIRRFSFASTVLRCTALFVLLAAMMSPHSAWAAYTFSYNPGTQVALATGGAAAVDALVLEASGGNILYSVNGSAFSANWGGNTVPASSALQINISVSTGNGSTITLGTPAGPASTLLGTIDVVATNNSSDQVIIDDSGSTTAQTYTVNTAPGTVTGTGTGTGFNYNEGGSAAYKGGITLNGSSAGSTYNIVSVFGSEPFSVVGGAGSDTFNVSALTLAAALSINGGDPTPPAFPGDTLTVSGTGALSAGGNPITSATGTSSAAGLQGTFAFTHGTPFTFQQIETVVPPVVDTSNLTITCTAGTTCTQPVILSGTGTAPFSLAINSGANAPGLSFDATSGVLSGIPTVAGMYTSAVTVTDANAGTVTANLTQIIVPGPATQLVVSAPASATVGATFNFTVTAQDQFGNTVTGYAGTLHFMSTDSSAVLPADYTFVAGDAGVHTFSATLYTAGSQTITATDTVTSTITGAAAITVNQAATTTTLMSSLNPSLPGQNVTFTATVAAVAPATGTPAGTVTFTDTTTSTTLGSVTLSGGAAILTTNSLAAGSHSITAMYNGNANYSTSTSSGLPQTVNQAATTTTLMSSLNPSLPGQNVTFTATVAAVAPATGTPAGTVTFTDTTTSTTLGSVTLSGGTATLTTNALAAGSHNITATYSGAPNYLTSTSSGFPQTVNQAATTTGLTSSLNPSMSGQNVTFTATVAAVAPATGTPTGTVTFTDTTTSTTLGSVTLSGGTATLTTNALTTGSHSIIAMYNGDTNYLTSSSSALNQIVNLISQAITFTSTAPTNALVGGSYTVTATGGASGNPVTFTIDAASTAGACTIAGSAVTFTGKGTCIIDANQAAAGNYAAAPQVQQMITIGAKPVPTPMLDRWALLLLGGLLGLISLVFGHKRL